MILVSCDIQPEYNFWIKPCFNLTQYGKYINRSRCSNIIYLINGRYTCGDITINDYKTYLEETCYINTNKIHNNQFFLDKGCNYVFELKDEIKLSNQHIVNIVKYMFTNNIYNINCYRINKQLEKELNIDAALFKRYNVDLKLPSFINFFTQFKNEKLKLIGGAATQCLWEVEIVLQALDIKYIKDEKFIYG